MKNFILAAGLTSGLALIAAPAFAGSAPDLSASYNKSENKVAAFTDTQMGGAVRNSGSAVERRNATLRRNAAARSGNARAAWQGSVHYY
ncbi:MAG TPA: hypothetical protein VN175_01320 [Rhizomicrobium sp.]|jgi:hypothetical protein|nr:hypothetical protein [Rhizomicrobium sp.]